MWDYFLLGHEQRIIKKGLASTLFYFLFGYVNSTLRMDHYHIIRSVKGLSLPDGARILDAGCGFGGCSLSVARLFPSCQIVGLDMNRELIRDSNLIARKYPLKNASFLVQDLDTFDSTNEYDIIYNLNVLEHIPDDQGLLKRFYTALKPGGHLILYVPNENRRYYIRNTSAGVPDYVEAVSTPHVRDGYSEEELRRKTKTAGFSRVECKYLQGIWGVLAQELTILFWHDKFLNSLTTLLTFPIAFLFGYLDCVLNHASGNSILLVARKS